MLLLKETSTSSGCTLCHTNMLQTVPLIHLFLGREEALRSAFFYFSLTYLRVTCWCLLVGVWFVWFYGVFLLYCLKFKCNFLKLTKRIFYSIFLSSSLPIPVPHQHITLEEVLLVKHNEINEVLYLLAFYE